MEIRLIWCPFFALTSDSKSALFPVVAKGRGIAVALARHKVEFPISKLHIELASQILSGLYKERLFLLPS